MAHLPLRRIGLGMHPTQPLLPSLLVGCPSLSTFKAATSVANRSLARSAAGPPSMTSDKSSTGMRASKLAWAFCPLRHGVFLDLRLVHAPSS